MSADKNDGANASSILVSDIEELTYTVEPWQLRMNQISCGLLRAEFYVAQVHGILLTREFWSHRIAASGLTPQGYVAIAAPCVRGGFSWCGTPTGSSVVAYSQGSSEIEFVTQDRDDHWTMLIPLALVQDHLGEELAADVLPKASLISADSRRVAQLTSLVLYILQLVAIDDGRLNDDQLLRTLEARLLEGAMSIFLSCDSVQFSSAQVTQRFFAYRRARNHVEASREAPSIEDLAKECGVGRRSLEVGFKEAMLMSPQRYSRYRRLNGLHRELLLESSRSVTEAAAGWGFTELGRMSGYYRELFGELPSATLLRETTMTGARLADALL